MKGKFSIQQKTKKGETTLEGTIEAWDNSGELFRVTLTKQGSREPSEKGKLLKGVVAIYMVSLKPEYDIAQSRFSSNGSSSGEEKPALETRVTPVYGDYKCKFTPALIEYFKSLPR